MSKDRDTVDFDYLQKLALGQDEKVL